MAEEPSIFRVVFMVVFTGLVSHRLFCVFVGGWGLDV